MELTTLERQFLFQCMVQDIDVRSNRKWKYSEHFCISCNDKFQEETQLHILNCPKLLPRNELVPYIPDYSELFSNEIEEQIYISNIIRENMRIRESIAQLPERTV